jgi:hypothetical protein
MSLFFKRNNFMTLRSGKKVYYKYQPNQYIIKRDTLYNNMYDNMDDNRENHHPIVLFSYIIFMALYAAVAFEIIKYKLITNGHNNF